MEQIAVALKDVRCKKHGKQCLLKTSLNSAPSEGQSYYICSVLEDRCNFVQKTQVPRVTCPQHSGNVIDLHNVYISSRTREIRHYYRCRVSRDASKSWCGHFVLGEITDDARNVDNTKRANDPVVGVTSNSTRSEATSRVSSSNDVISNDGSLVRTSSITNSKRGNDTKYSNVSESETQSQNSSASLGNELAKDSCPVDEASTNETQRSASDFHSAISGGETASGGLSENPNVDKPFGSHLVENLPRGFDGYSGFRGPIEQRSGCSDDFSIRKVTSIPAEPRNKKSSLSEINAPEKDKKWTEFRSPQRKNETETRPPKSLVPRDKVIDLTDDGLATDFAASTECVADLRGRSVDDLCSVVNRQLDQQKALLKTVKISALPDNGGKIRQKINELEDQLRLLNISRDNRAEGLNPVIVPHSEIKSQDSVINKTAKENQLQFLNVNQDSGARGLNPVILPRPEIKNQDGVNSKPVKVIVVHPKQPLPPPARDPAPVAMRQTSLLSHVERLSPHALQQMYASQPQAMTLYGGRMTKNQLREVGSITRDAIDDLHKQLESAPGEGEECTDPGALKTALFPHQRHALAWMLWRERQRPPGGILADDMGLGKTLTMISLVLHTKQQTDTDDASRDDWKSKGKTVEKLEAGVLASRATLVVCPASLVHQWNSEVERRCRRGALRVLVYHGPNRESNVSKLADNDLVLTTYNIVSKEIGIDEGVAKAELPVDDGAESQARDQPNLLRIGWQRVILDEAHNIKNHKSKTSVAICRLRAGARWALTGTPIQNDLLDMYSLLRFLRCSPFDELKVWKKQVDSDKYSGKTRLNTLIKTLLLRRTKDQKTMSGEALVSLPSKSVMIHTLRLSAAERCVYDKVYKRSRSTFQEYLARHQRGGSSRQAPQNQGGAKQASGTYILVSLLRLRQCCSHLSLLKDRVDDDLLENEGIEMGLEEQMRGLVLDDLTPNSGPAPPHSHGAASWLFNRDQCSTKIQAVMDEVRGVSRATGDKQPIKFVIVSQWTAMLDIVSHHINKAGITSCTIRGDIPPKKRGEIVDEFNNNPTKPLVMLLSLRAGGVGLNLVGGSHLFLLDNHWNPSLEDQACDRIYRLGQKRDVVIHRFLCENTVEEKIIQLQQRKIGLAKDILSGSGAREKKLTLDDMRMLFGV